MSYKTVNLEAGMPTTDIAKNRLTQALRSAKAERAKAVKLIHGYGSGGTGGAIKRCCHGILEEKKKSGFIKDYIKGEEFTPFYSKTKALVAYYPLLAKDRDYTHENDGITIVIF